MARVKHTATTIHGALRERFSAPAWAYFEEVGNATGFACNRHADAIAMSLWPSRGLEIHGIEIKVSRGDWKRELDNPEKADDVAKHCDRWWLAVSDAAIVLDGELPPTWGLLVYADGKMTCKREAPKLGEPELTRSFVAALFRRAHETVERVRSRAFDDGREEGQRMGPEGHQRIVSNLEYSLETLRKSLAEFEEKSGIKIDEWDGGNVGEAVRRVLNVRQRQFGPAPDPDGSIERAAGWLEREAQELRKYVAEEKRREAAIVKAVGVAS